MSTPPLTGQAKIIHGKDQVVIGFVLIVFFITNHAGAQAAAALAALGGLIGIIGHRPSKIEDWPASIWLLIGFVLWCAISSLWSPYQSQRSLPGIVRFVFGVPLYGFCVFMMKDQLSSSQANWNRASTFLITLSALVFALDLGSSFGITRLAVPEAAFGDIEQNLTHGVSVLLICLPPAIIALLRAPRFGLALFAFLIFWSYVAAYSTSNTAASLALPALLLFMTGGYLWPRQTLRIAILIPILGLSLAPVLALVASKLPSSLVQSLPFSWEWRVKTWTYLGEKIAENPFFGSGFDSLRSFDAVFSARGFTDLSVVPNHAHNFGLHVWTETGAMGALLLSAALWRIYVEINRSRWLTRGRCSALCGFIITVSIFSSLSYSAWQDWWLGAIAIGAGLITHIGRAGRKQSASGS